MRLTSGPSLSASNYLCVTHDGDEVIGVEGPCFGLVTIRMTWLAGTCDVAEAAGRAVWDLLERGTADEERAAWFTALESLGASVEARIGRTWAALEVDAMSPWIAEAASRALAPALAPNEDPEELDDWRDELAEELAADLDDVEGAVERLWPARLWDGQIWGRSSAGRAAVRDDLDAEALANARAELLGAPVVVTIAADEPAAHVALATSLIDQLRAQVPRRARPVRAAPRLQPGGAWVAYPESEQGALRFAVPCTAPADDAWAATAVHAAMFGGGFASPLIRRLRGELGLSYDVSWSASAQPGAGLWSGRVLPGAGDLRRTWEEVTACWTRFREEPVDAELLALARSLLIGQHLAALETAGSRAAHAALLRAFDLPLSRSWSLPAAIETVDVEAISAISATASALTSGAWAAGCRAASEAPPNSEEWAFGPDRDVPSRLAKKAGGR